MNLTRQPSAECWPFCESVLCCQHCDCQQIMVHKSASSQLAHKRGDIYLLACCRLIPHTLSQSS